MLRSFSILGGHEGLLKSQLLIKDSGTGQIGDADGDMRDPSEVCWLYLSHPKQGK
jgi:hypothetical protein